MALRAAPQLDMAYRHLPGQVGAEVLFLANSPFPLFEVDGLWNGLRLVTRCPAQISAGAGQGGVPFAVPGQARDLHDLANLFLEGGALQARLPPQRPGQRRGCMTFMANGRTEALAARNGLEWFNIPQALYARLNDRFAGLALARRAGLRLIDHAVIEAGSFAELARSTAHLGAALVVQTAQGYAGRTTHFISSHADWLAAFGTDRSRQRLKVMRQIDCLELAMEGCVTPHGPIAGPLMTEIVGLPALTRNRASWCGNEIAVPRLPRDIRAEAQRQTLQLGRELARLGYLGMFEVDYLMDRQSGALFFGELNPRFSGAGTVSNIHLMARGLPPLALFHALAFANPQAEFDVPSLNREILEGEGPVLSQIILRNLGPEAAFAALPKAGPVRVAPGLDAAAYVPEVAPGQAVEVEDEIGSLLLSGTLALAAPGRLLPEVAAALTRLRVGFVAQADLGRTGQGAAGFDRGSANG